jgi:hypothetical protein
MRLFLLKNTRFEEYKLAPRGRCCPIELENWIRTNAHENGNISNLSVQIGQEYIPLCHVDEARIISRMLTADHDCFVSHLYQNGFDTIDKNDSNIKVEEAMPQDLYEANELWKLEFEYEQNEELGTPSFGCSKSNAEDF